MLDVWQLVTFVESRGPNLFYPQTFQDFRDSSNGKVPPQRQPRGDGGTKVLQSDVEDGTIIDSVQDQRTKGRKPYRTRHRFFGGKKKKDVVENMEKKVEDMMENEDDLVKEQEIVEIKRKDDHKNIEVDENDEINNDARRKIKNHIKGILFLKDNLDISEELGNQLKKRGYHIETINNNSDDREDYDENDHADTRSRDINDNFERYDYNIRK